MYNQRQATLWHLGSAMISPKMWGKRCHVYILHILTLGNTTSGINRLVHDSWASKHRETTWSKVCKRSVHTSIAFSCGADISITFCRSSMQLTEFQVKMNLTLLRQRIAVMLQSLCSAVQRVKCSTDAAGVVWVISMVQAWRRLFAHNRKLLTWQIIIFEDSRKMTAGDSIVHRLIFCHADMPVLFWS